MFVLMRQPMNYGKNVCLCTMIRMKKILFCQKMDNMFDNFNDKKEINHLCLIVNEQVGDSNSSDDAYDRNISKETKTEKKSTKFQMRYMIV